MKRDIRTFLVISAAAIGIALLWLVLVPNSDSHGCPVILGCHSGVDSIRIADLQQIQNDLALYFKTCGVYPGGKIASGLDQKCKNVSKPIQLVGILNITNIPSDPVTGADYAYCYTPEGASYVLQANLTDIHSSELAGSLSEPLANCTDALGTVTCDKAQGQYCISAAQ